MDWGTGMDWGTEMDWRTPFFNPARRPQTNRNEAGNDRRNHSSTTPDPTKLFDSLKNRLQNKQYDVPKDIFGKHMSNREEERFEGLFAQYRDTVEKWEKLNRKLETFWLSYWENGGGRTWINESRGHNRQDGRLPMWRHESHGYNRQDDGLPMRRHESHGYHRQDDRLPMWRHESRGYHRQGDHIESWHFSWP